MADRAEEGREGGYDYEFLDSSLAVDYECMICHYVTRNPRQAQCCGATYCGSCIARSRRTLPECPNCRAPSFILIQDKAQQQRINKLRIKCPHCQWTGAVADIETHTAIEHADLLGRRRVAEVEVEELEQEAEAPTAHARTQDWSFSDTVDNREGDECEPLIELKRLAAADDEPLKAGSGGEERSSRDVSPQPNAAHCTSKHCTKQVLHECIKYVDVVCAIISRGPDVFFHVWVAID